MNINVSTSQNATMIRFIGGPQHGRYELHDHDQFQSIQFCDSARKQTDVYTRKGPSLYEFGYTFTWSPERRRKVNFELSI